MSRQVVRRMVALAAVVPTVLLSAPLGGVASAVESLTATAVPVLVDPATSVAVVGPRAGFLRGLDSLHPAATGITGAGERSIDGITPLFRVDHASTGSVTRVTVGLTKQSAADPALSVFRDFDASNGFAVYQDVSSTACAGAVAGTFDPCDLSSGQASSGFSVVPGSSGRVDLALTLTSKAKGATSYWVVIHPAEANTADRRIKVSLEHFEQAAASTSVPMSSTGPQALTIDSQAPTAPVRANFTADPKPAGTDDGYVVEGAELNRTIAFLRSSDGTSREDLLVRTDAAPAVAKVTSSKQRIQIGDGTGIAAAVGSTPAVTTAKNGQQSDSVYARALDFAGNLSAAAALDNGDGTSSATTGRKGNDVTAPSFTSQPVVAINHPDRGVNAGNVTAVPVTVTATPSAGAAGCDSSAAGTAACKQRALAFAVDAEGLRVTHLVDGVATPLDPTPWSPVTDRTPTTTAGHKSLVDASSLPDNSLIALQAEITDALGNATLPLYSAQDDQGHFSASWKKDTTPLAVSVLQRVGSTVDIRFSKPVLASDISEGTAAAGCTKCVPELIKRTPAPTCGTGWGTGSSFAWQDKGDDGTASFGKVTLGSAAHCAGAPLSPGTDEDLVDNGDTVTFPAASAAATIADEAGNAVSPSTRQLVVAETLPTSAIGRDTALRDGVPLFGQARDGILDQVTVTFSNNVTFDSAPGAVHLVVRGADGDLPVTSVEYAKNGSNADILNQLVLHFDGRLSDGSVKTLLSGETPFVVAAVDPTTDEPYTQLGITSTPPLTFAPVRAADGAAPAVTDAHTADSNGDGKIDRVVLTWSESIAATRADWENPCGYVVTQPAAGDKPAVDRYSPDPDHCVPGTVSFGGTEESNQVEATSDATHSTLLIKTSSASDTDARPTVTYVPGNSTTDDSPLGSPEYGLPADAAGNVASAPINGQVLDGAAPLVVSRTTGDLDSDGHLDSVTIVYSEVIDSLSLGSATFTVADDAYKVSAIGQTAANDVQLLLDEHTAFDTDALLTVKYEGGTAEDAYGLRDAGNAPVTPETEATAAVDGAAPVLVSATRTFSGATAKQVKVAFSEPVTNSEVAPEDFKVYSAKSPTAALVPAALSGECTGEGDGTSCVLTMAATLSRGYDSLVQLAAPGAVKDRAAEPNDSTSTAKALAPYVIVNGTYKALSPVRILDTKAGTGGVPVAKLGAGKSLTFQVTGKGGVASSSVAAVVLNVTGGGPAAESNLTLYPAGASKPAISNLTVPAGLYRDNLVTVKPGTGGKVTVYNSASAMDVYVEVQGYYVDATAATTAAGGTYYPITPTRLVDTRKALGGHAGPLGAGETFGFKMTGTVVPSTGVKAVAVSVTGLNATANGGKVSAYYPVGLAVPNVSTVHTYKGRAATNTAIVKLGDVGGSTGRITLRNSSGSTDVLVEVLGYFTETALDSGTAFKAKSAPIRKLDTSKPTGVATAAKVAAGSTTDASLGGPSCVQAALVNLKAGDPDSAGNLVAFPAGVALPSTDRPTSLNYVKDDFVAALTVVGTTGSLHRISIRTTARTHLVGDVYGYFVAAPQVDDTACAV